MRIEPNRHAHAAARRALHEAAAHGGEAALKADAAIHSVTRTAIQPPPYAAYFGLTLVSCEHGDIRQTPRGLMVYGDAERWESPLTPGISGRDLMVTELYAAVAEGIPPLHSARWAKATLEVSLAVLESSRTRREVRLSHQVPTND
jgi:phthalate 4,5-cis-dihydrodiol dehydrogenase